MKVFVTGASGFVGAHTARALLMRGHDVCLLARNPEQVRTYFNRHGFEDVEIAQGDMRDQAAVREGLRGCDGVVHAAAIVSVDPKRSAEIYRNNVDGIETVLGTACHMGLERVVYVSSMSVLFQPGISYIDESVPLGQPVQAYARSKRDADAHVRQMQAQGMPIQMTYPVGVFGPDDPKLSEANHGLVSFLKVVPQTATGIQCVDARDLALVHCHLLEHPAQGDFSACRFIVGGHYYKWAEFHRLLSDLTGRQIQNPSLPPGLMRALGSAVDLAGKVIRFQTQISREAMGYVTEWAFADSSRIRSHMGIEFRSGEDTFADTIRWLVAMGHMKPHLAGKLA